MWSRSSVGREETVRWGVEVGRDLARVRSWGLEAS